MDSLLAQMPERPVPRGGAGWLLRRRRAVEVMLDLAPIRRRLSDKWEKVAPSVRRFATHVIERHLDGDPSYTLTGDVFVIRFARMRRDEAESRRREIEKELLELLFGSGESAESAVLHHQPRHVRGRRHGHGRFMQFFAQLRRVFDPSRLRFKRLNAVHRAPLPVAATAAAPHDIDRAVLPAAATTGPPVRNLTGAAQSPSMSAEQPGGVAATEISSAMPDVSAVPTATMPHDAAAVAAAAREATTAKPQPGPDPAKTAEALWWQNNEAEQHDQQAHVPHGATVGRHSASRPGGTEPFDDGTGQPDSAETPDAAAGSSRARGRVRHASTDALERALYAAILEARYQTDLAQRARLFPPMGTRFLYRPLWNIGRGTLPIYTCTPACALGPFEFITGEALLSKNAGPRKIAMLDEMVLSCVSDELRSQQASQLRSVICIPVHYETLVGERVAVWISLLETIPRTIRDKVIVEIVNLTQGVGQLATYSLVRKLKSHVRYVFGRLDFGDVNFRAWRETDVAVVGIDVEVDDRPEIDVINEINHFASLAKQHGLHTYVRGLRSLSLAVAAIAAGVEYMDGPAVAEGDFVLPVVPKPFGIFDIYREI